ncbi:glucosamine-6-phosphate deaminase [Peptostreptococcus faecalis]|uniref:glucosamine-6-phosphate deaminase n=1 Tax=Peptostreptococcus faecalis TaxID=2045015 RepID=UPI000C798EAF|nr:glucosamine-6-phosphate deaminase [Peptostreptococcus faecalis]
MKIYVCENYDRMSEVAANYVAAQITLKPNSILGLATGSTPEGLYRQLVEKYNKKEIDFNDIISFNLDEYLDLPKEDVNSYYTFMHENLFNHVNIKEENINIPEGNVDDIESYAMKYDNKIDSSGGIDLQVLGIGNNAHIGFNEPSDTFSRYTEVVNLTPETIEANARFFDNEDDVPKKAISMGIGTIMKSKKIVLIASGEEKAQAVNDMINGRIDPKVPASILQLHEDVLVVLDEAAAKKIDKKLYKKI